MHVRSIFTSWALALSLAAVSGVAAAAELPFSEKAFALSQTENKPILVHVWASWCPTCKAQAPTLSAIEADPANKDLVVYKIDFDTQKDAVRDLGVRTQSTLIAFHGTAEKARSAGDTNPDSIKALAAKARQ